MRNLRLLFIPLLLAACATTPKFETSGLDLKITPQQVVESSGSARGSRVLWGGVIIATSNLRQATQFEILAYPLDGDQRPDTGKAPLGRFIARQEGYLESSLYSQGRRLTVSGELQESHTGRIGEADYTYPVLRIEQLQLWPRRGESSEPQFHFGVGVMLHN